MTKEMQELKAFLDEKVLQYNRPDFIEKDPISIPNAYKTLQDKEITAFFAATLAWGQRKTIINKCSELFERMDGVPYQFIIEHQENDLKKLLKFKHRTFNDTDLLYFIAFLKEHYQKNSSLETAFSAFLPQEAPTIEPALIGFQKLFFSLPDAPKRTQKHVATPTRKSACKRLCMFLRWFVRNNEGVQGVDFGLWKQIKPSQLICPLDLHVERVARKLGLLKRSQTDWTAALELTENLRNFDKKDPTKYDFALFGLGVEENFWKK